MLSSKNANSWKEVLTGEPLESEEQLKGMCLKIMAQKNIITVTGYGNKAVFNCTVATNSKECHATQESSFPEMADKTG